MSPNTAKFKELILFVCHRSEGDKTFGATKLNKLLFYCDFLAFLTLGNAISGHRYQKLKNGPAPRAMVPVLREMQDAGDVAMAEHDFYGLTQKRTVALRDANLSEFTAEEIALVTNIIDDCRGKNAKEISDMSHRFRGWQLAEKGEDIPYSVATVRFEEPKASDMRDLPPEKIAEIKALAADAS